LLFDDNRIWRFKDQRRIDYEGDDDDDYDDYDDEENGP